ncbi:MAG: methyltransferase domain-containing protein [Bacteroidota bacterium]
MAHYIHGSDPEEQQRLSLLNRLMNDRYLPKVPVREGMRVFDAGSGLGQFSARLAEVVGPNGFCLGLERDEQQLAVARTLEGPVLHFRQGDIFSIPFHPGEEGSFDLVHARFLLEHLPDPARAIRQMKRALKPGGTLCISDDDHQAMVLFPEPEGFRQLWDAYMDAYVEVGNDPWIGRKLPKLFHEQGFCDIRIDTAFFGDVSGSPTFDGFVTNLIEVIATGRSVMEENDLITPQAFDAAIDAIRTWAKLPYAAIWYPLCVCTGTL